MANTDYIERLKQVIFHLHGVDSNHIDSVRVQEIYQGKTLWRGTVEVFEIDSPKTKAKRCYGWSFGDPEEFITILGLPPVDSAQAAVKVGVAYEVKKARKAE